MGAEVAVGTITRRARRPNGERKISKYKTGRAGKAVGKNKNTGVKSGIPLYFPKAHRVAQLARAAGVEILCDIELLYHANPEARFVGITGTNGKSTTTACSPISRSRRRAERRRRQSRPRRPRTTPARDDGRVYARNVDLHVGANRRFPLRCGDNAESHRRSPRPPSRHGRLSGQPSGRSSRTKPPPIWRCAG